MALAGVRPVGDINTPVGPHVHGDGAEPGVVRREEVVGVLDDVPRALALDRVAVDPIAVDVAGEEAAAILGRDAVAEVDHGPGMGVAAAGAVGGWGDAERADVAP